MRALCEWATGNFIDISQPSCESSRHFEVVHSRLLKKLVESKLCETESWVTLQKAVSDTQSLF